ncbi:DUF885 family protein [Rubripirellula reticaptiva]|uniref:Prolyl tripeptidyl peptidase n=1 Tax=Rubripirellula reticaptiva TaxID=2528013 RepID=A0A5C6F9M7_9BACT|nr:DUF885 family protein [Rubripirellula reticaptiva]TWU56349.1 Prolyl tripeptidyl peptidase precursor [Rubripirellula reticaptiva]
MLDWRILVVLGCTFPAMASVTTAGDAADVSRTINTRIVPQWSDQHHFLFLRETETGAHEKVNVDAATGTMVIDLPGVSDQAVDTQGFTGGPVPPSGPTVDDTEIELVNATDHIVQLFWNDSNGSRQPYGHLEPGQSRRQHTYVGHVWVAVDQDGNFYGSAVAQATRIVAEIKRKFPHSRTGRRSAKSKPSAPANRNESVDRRWKSRIEGGQLQLLDQKSDDASWMSVDLDAVLPESDRNLSGMDFSPDGSVLAVWQTRTGDHHQVFTLESSPQGGGRAKLQSRSYELPGDAMDQHQLLFVDVESATPLKVDLPMFDFGRPNLRWCDGNELLIEKVDRGHQRFRLFRVDPLTNTVLTPIDEQTETFIWTIHRTSMPLISYLSSSDEVIYSSERDGYRHLYLIDTAKEAAWKPITSGDWLVRDIIDVDEAKRTLDLIVGEYHDDQDPYHQHVIRIGFDGDHETALTQSDGDHSVQFSPDRDYLIATHSRVDSPPVHELRRVSDGQLICTLATAQRLGAEAQSHPLPTVFSARGRDGNTDIWGMITFPPDYDPESDKRYPVIEAIYAGPHDSHVPKKYRHPDWHQDLTSLGFIVVNIDGMGTANRSKAFHNVCWHNLKDAGFPDRIAWMRAAAKQYPAMDLDQVGIYGTSAGGQNACGALLFHGDFYKAAMASCGCHDNRMDKASWNEQWMGYPVGDHYSENSNIDHAAKLKGNLLLIVGELDTNVPPESTYRLVDALIRADKTFDFIMIPGLGHSDGGTYGRRRTWDFFVEKLQTDRSVTSASDTASLASTTQRAPEIGELESLSPRSVWENVRQRYLADRGSIQRRFPIRFSPEGIVQKQRFIDAWQSKLEAEPRLGSDSQDIMEIAKSKLIEDIGNDAVKIDESRQTLELITQHAPFLNELIDLCDLDQRGTTLDFPMISTTLESVNFQLRSAWATPDETPSVSESFVDAIKQLNDEFVSWNNFYNEYNPEYDWWVAPQATKTIAELQSFIDRVNTSEAPSPSIEKATSSTNPFASEFPVMLAAGYPNLKSYTRAGPAWMPAIMQKYLDDFGPNRIGEASLQSDKQAYLNQWKSALDSLKIDGKEFEDWPTAEQTDYLLLRQEIAYQIAKYKHDQNHETRVSRADDDSGLSGVVVGRERLMTELEREFIGNTPEELISLAQNEYVKCRREMVLAAQEMGYGNDWQAAVEKVKSMHVRVGAQPKLIRLLAEESIDWLEKKGTVTIDPLAKSSWQMEMMSPKRQLINPFFTGGETISISFPSRGMSTEQKRQSLRGNNIPFARATVHHELIPGHHLQGFQNNRYQTHRKMFGTPFWLEGWAVYWEFRLHENGFARTPEERLGFLVWRAHRYARIIFSLNFHLGHFSPNQCVDFLIDNVGFDKKNATAEVRRSIGSGYPPLYQAAYMLGAMQLRKVADQLKAPSTETLKEFHNTVMENNCLPIALVNAIVNGGYMQADQPPMWRF